MLAAVADLNPFAARADEIFQRGVHVQGVAHLVKVGHRDIRTLAHRTPRAVARFGRRGVGWRGVGLQFAQNELEQGRFARAIGPEQSDFVAPQNGGAEIIHDFARAKTFGNMGQLGHQLAADGAAVDIHINAAHDFAARLTLRAQLIEAHDAGRGAGAPGFHAFANPDLFLRQEFVCAGVEHGLLRQLLFFLQQIGGKVSGIRQQLTPVQFDDAGGHIVQKSPVVGDGDDAAAKVHQQAFKPLDAVQVQVVGGLVQEQHVGLRDQGLG